jgi:hypothetical protein
VLTNTRAEGLPYAAGRIFFAPFCDMPVAPGAGILSHADKTMDFHENSG